ncbi:MAG: Vitamin B12 transporter BtuB [Steroidobacteraceae bacterium]|nr:Vitamin B12 transporter BtuB [Steroidobacteraceae bacterium]
MSQSSLHVSKPGARPNGGRWSVAIACFAGLCGAAGGRAVLGADAEADTGGPRIEEVVVTARRRAEDVQSVPISVTAISSDALRENSVSTILDLQSLAPSLNMLTFAEDPTISLRGQGGFNPGSSPAVVGYVNEVPLPATAGSNGGAFLIGGLYDLESIQVLNGPQGTLFGRNTTGGAILFQSRRPTDRFEGYAEATLGNYDNREIEFALNVPVVDDRVLLRFAGKRQERRGYTRTLGTPSHPGGLDLDNRDNWAGRISLTLKAGDAFRNDTILSYYDSDTHNASSPLGYIAPGGFADFLYPQLSTLLAQQQALGARTQLPIGVNQFNRMTQWSLTNITEFEATEQVTIRNIFGFYENETSSAMDGDGTTLGVFDYPDAYQTPTVNRQFTEELQLQGKSSSGRLEWVGGAFVLYQPRPTPDHYTYTVFGGTPYGSVSTTQLAAADDSRALYGQFTYDLSDLLLDGLRVTAGYRYTWDERFTMIVRTQPICLTERRNPLCFAKFQSPTWTFALDYQLAPDVLIYGTVRRGFRAGGLNDVSGPNIPRSFPPEHLTDQEVGIKSRWNLAGMPGQTNVAVYHQDYDDIHVSRSILNPDGTVPIVTTAGASASIWGAEFEGAFYPVESLELRAGLSWIELERYKNFSAFLTPLDIARIEGNKLNQRPKFTYNVSARYRLPVRASLGDVALAANWAWRSRQGSVNPPGEAADPLKMRQSYGWLNLSADWNSIAGRPLDASVYVTNALDDAVAYGQMTVAESIGTSTLHYLEPRMYGLRVRYRFGE